MSRRDPHTLGLTFNGRIAAANADASDRLAAIERGAGSTLIVGSTGTTVGDATTVVKGKVMLAGDIAGTAASVLVKKLTSLGTTAMTDQIANDTVHGELSYGSGYAGQRWDIRHGRVGGTGPVTVPQPTFRISMTQEHTTGVTNGADFNKYNALHVTNRGLSGTLAQPIAAVFVAFSDGTATYNPNTANTDAMGFQAVGNIMTNGTGRGLGGTVGGRTQSTVATSGATGIELYAENRTGTDDLIAVGGTGSGSRTMGIWLHTGDSTDPVAAGIQFGRQAGNIPFHTGIYFNKTGAQGDPISDASIRDDGISNYGLLIKGVKATAAISVALGAGNVGIGELAPSYPLTAVRSTSGAVAYFANSTAAQTVVNIFSSATGQQALLSFGHESTGAGPKWQTGRDTTGDFILYDPVGGFIPTTITTNAGTRTIRTKAMTDQLVSDTTHGAFVGDGVSGQRYEIRHGLGTNPTAVTTDGATFRISRYSHHATTTAGAAYEKYAALQVWHASSSTTKAQPIAGFFQAQSTSTQARVVPTSNPDALGLQAIGKVDGSGVGRALAASFEAASTSTTGLMTAVEVVNRNNTGSDHTLNTSDGSNSMGLWIYSHGPKKSAAGIQFGAATASGGGWDTGIYFTGTASGITNAAIRDDSTATISHDIRGTHTAALQTGSTAGYVAIGVTGAAAVIGDTGCLIDPAGVVNCYTANSTTAFEVFRVTTAVDTLGRFKIAMDSGQLAGLYWGNGGSYDVRIWRSAASTLSVQNVTAAAAHIAFPVAASSIKFDAGGFISAAAAGAGLKVGNATTDELGFYGVTPVNQRAAITAPTGGSVIDAEARTAINSLRQALIDLGLTA